MGADIDRQQSCEHVARTLLRRYGVVFRKLLEQEDAVPSWRELLYVYRRLEARGELRSGRFVQGSSGEQYALPEAVDLLREVRKRPKQGDLLAISAADPLNLTGIITAGQRIPALPQQRILYRDGVPAAMSSHGKVDYLIDVGSEQQQQIGNMLLRRQAAALA